MKNLDKKGSAILIVMLLITVLATVALTVGYLAMAEVSMETSSQDGSMAYYAAEAGIEEGLLRYRYDSNVEVGKYKDTSIVDPIINAKPCTDLLSNKECGDRVDVTAGSRVENQDLNITPPEPLKQYYDLRIRYKEDNSANFGAALAASDKKLDKDEALTLDGFANNTTLTFKFMSLDNRCTPANCFVQFRGTSNGIEYANFAAAGANTTKSIVVNFGVPLEIKFWSIPGIDTTHPSVFINYKIKAETTGAPVAPLAVDSGTTTIESTGYFGSAKRRLQATIDRKTGKLLEIFDFTLNSTQGNIVTP